MAADPMQLPLGEGPEPVVGARHDPDARVARVRPDVVGMDRLLDYLVPKDSVIEVGDVVRVPLGGRSTGGWVTALDVEAESGIDLLPIERVTGRGPTPELIDLAGWAAWRWAGRPVHFLRAATPPTAVRELPTLRRPADTGAVEARGSGTTPDFDSALASNLGLLVVGPAEDRYPIVATAARQRRGGQTLVLCPGVGEAAALARRLGRDGFEVALLAGQEPASRRSTEWARAKAGANVVVGTRSAAWAPLTRLGRVVVFDEHDEAYQGEKTPTWNARDVAIERGRRAEAPTLLVSATPSLEALSRTDIVERQPRPNHGGWPAVEVVDQRDRDPAHGPLFSPRAVQLARDGGRVLFILDRTGRVRLLACAGCSSIAACETCGGPTSLEAPADDAVEQLVCRRDDHRRPPVCLTCGATRFRNLRLGVGRAREELEALALRPVGEVTAASPAVPDADVLIGTEALLHRVTAADAVVFLDADQHLLAMRTRAAEQALDHFARGARIAARRRGRVVIQTRHPEHPAVVAAATGDGGPFRAGESEMRRALGLPPATSMALISGRGAPTLIESLEGIAGVEIQGPVDGTWRLRAPDHATLCDALAAVPRPEERTRVEVDPLGL